MKNKILCLILCLFCFLVTDSAFAYVQQNKIYTNNYDVAYSILQNTDISINDMQLLNFVEYLDNYILENKSSNIDYSIFVSNQGSSNASSFSNTYYVHVILFNDYSSDCNLESFYALTRDTSNSYYSSGQFHISSSCSFSYISYNNISNFDLTQLTNYITNQDNTLYSDNDYSITAGYYLYLSNGSNLENFEFSVEDKRFLLPYSSTIDYVFNYSDSDNYYFRDSLNILKDNITTNYVVGDVIPFYLEKSEDLEKVEYTNFIDNYYGLFFSQIPKDNLYNYSIDFTVAQNIIYSDIDYEFNLFGRVNHGKYFTYEPISCIVGFTSDDPVYGGSGVGQSTYIYQTKHFGIMDCTSDLTNYDFIYINAYSINPTDLYYFSCSTNYGIASLNDFISSPYKVVDYFDFIKDTNFFITSNNYSTSVYYGSLEFDKFTTTSYNLTNFENKKYFIGNRFNNLYRFYERYDYIGQSTNVGLGFNLFSNYENANLYVLVDDDILISYDSDISTNEDFYYYNSTGDIVNNNFKVYHSYDNNTNNTVDNYFSVVTNFLDSISNDITSFSLVLQNAYDLAPQNIQTIIFVFYILIMSFILFKLIGK